jgi:hypothetical protein
LNKATSRKKRKKRVKKRKSKDLPTLELSYHISKLPSSSAAAAIDSDVKEDEQSSDPKKQDLKSEASSLSFVDSSPVIKATSSKKQKKEGQKTKVERLANTGVILPCQQVTFIVSCCCCR